MLTAEQKVLVKAVIVGDPSFDNVAHDADGAYTIADALNLAASPAFIVWKTNVPIDEIMRNGMDWSQVDNLSNGKARIWDWLSKLGSINPSKISIRSGIDACWVGTAAMLAVRAVVYTHCKRPATRAEKAMATGTGTTETPATMSYEGVITYLDVLETMGW
jgi:hypothetical protein